MKRLGESIVLSRDVEAVQIPSGFTMILEEGTNVEITQSLGGSYTVTTSQGLARINGHDADALGIEAAEAPTSATSATSGPTPTVASEVEPLVWEQLKTCYDPEIPVNIVDLGLVYECRVEPADDGSFRVLVEFTLTAPGCGMGDWLAYDMRAKIESLPGVKEVAVEVVFDPPWDQSRMSEAARLELGMF